MSRRRTTTRRTTTGESSGQKSTVGSAGCSLPIHRKPIRKVRSVIDGVLDGAYFECRISLPRQASVRSVESGRGTWLWLGLSLHIRWVDRRCNTESIPCRSSLGVGSAK